MTMIYLIHGKRGGDPKTTLQVALVISILSVAMGQTARSIEQDVNSRLVTDFYKQDSYNSATELFSVQKDTIEKYKAGTTVKHDDMLLDARSTVGRRRRRATDPVNTRGLTYETRIVVAVHDNTVVVSMVIGIWEKQSRKLVLTFEFTFEFSITDRKRRGAMSWAKYFGRPRRSTIGQDEDVDKFACGHHYSEGSDDIQIGNDDRCMVNYPDWRKEYSWMTLVGQTATQSSENRNRPAHLAIDGKFGRESVIERECSQTGVSVVKAKLEWWKTTIPNVDIKAVRIHDRRLLQYSTLHSASIYIKHNGEDYYCGKVGRLRATKTYVVELDEPCRGYGEGRFLVLRVHGIHHGIGICEIEILASTLENAL